MHYLDTLNEEQKKAVLQTEGPVLVLAGAGTGKTRVLTTRIIHILATRKAFAPQILAVTFTNKAAREMQSRIKNFLGPDCALPYMGTFHSIGAKILRQHAHDIGLKKNFTILDKPDSQNLLKQVLEDNQINLDQFPPASVAYLIEQWKNEALQPFQLNEHQNFQLAGGQGRAIYEKYQQRLREVNGCDFNDLLLLPIQLLQKNPEILQLYHNRFRYLLVDEYQDTNTAQYLWLRLLAQRPRTQAPNICCVGDDDQSIYSWRGAKVQNILRFEKDFPDALIIRLERNYRSTTPILSAASHLIAHNEERLGKTLFSDQEHKSANKINIYSTSNDKEEAYFIGKKIEDLLQKNIPAREIAVLIRAKFQAKILQDEFSRLSIPHRLVGVESFYSRLEIKDALAYLRIVAQPYDDMAFIRIVNTPKRGIGSRSLFKIRDIAKEKRESLFSASRLAVEKKIFSGKLHQSLEDIVQKILKWQALLKVIPCAELLETILEQSGYYEMWYSKNNIDIVERLNNLKDLVAYAKQFKDIESFLEEVSLLTDRSESTNSENAVSIMTLHAAKGLEFDTVFLPGWEESLFPHANALNASGKKGEEELEEERRLAYVGITRAKKNLHIFHAYQRFIHGETKNNDPSRFLGELPKEYIQKESLSQFYNSYNQDNDYFMPKKTKAFDHAKTLQELMQMDSYPPRSRNLYSARPSFQREANLKSTRSLQDDFYIGERVFSQKFGPGTITDMEHNKLTVLFDKAGEKRILSSFVIKLSELA